VGYLGTLRSFRGAPREALVRTGADRALVRAELEEDGRPLLVEAEVARQGRSRIQVNRSPARSRRDLARAVPLTVFSPEDLVLAQGAPAGRRDLLDDALALLDAEGAAAAEETERAVRQRGALLRQAGPRPGAEVLTTLDVWDARLAAAGGRLVAARTALVDRLVPEAAEGYARLSGGEERLALAYRPSWTGDLAEALAAARADDLRRGVSTVGPHRDDLALDLAGRDVRVQASQGEQRGVALALRLGVHRLVTRARGRPPLLLLDDVFSELDPARSRALVADLPTGQALVTTAVPLPAGVEVATLVELTREGR
jgi:DNA replication and repair protein RecF